MVVVKGSNAPSRGHNKFLKKLVGGSGHINIEMFAFGTLLVHKLNITLFVGARCKNDGHYLEQRFFRKAAEPRFEIDRDCGLKFPD